MNKDELNAIIDEYINTNAEEINVKNWSEIIADQVECGGDELRELKRARIEQVIRGRLARIKDENNVRDFFAIPVDGEKGVYANATKSHDADALERTAKVLDYKSIGLQASRDKLLSQAFKLRHNVEIKDDGTIDTKTPYTE